MMREASGRIITEREAIGRLMEFGVPAEDVAQAHGIPVASVLLIDLIFRRKREVRARMAGLSPRVRTYRKATRPPAPRLSASDGCQWPAGLKGHADFHCGAERYEDHLPYCWKHNCIAFTTFEARRAA